MLRSAPTLIETKGWELVRRFGRCEGLDLALQTVGWLVASGGELIEADAGGSRAVFTVRLPRSGHRGRELTAQGAWSVGEREALSAGWCVREAF